MNAFDEAAELVRAAMLNIARASGKLETQGTRHEKPLEYYELNKVWLQLEELTRDLDRKARV